MSKQEIAPASTISSDIASSSEVHDAAEKKVRGMTRNIALLDAYDDKGPLPIQITSELKQATGKYASWFNNLCGVVVRECAPLDVKGWKEIPLQQKLPMYQRVMDKFQVDPNSKHVHRVINHQMSKSYRTWRSELNKHFKKEGGHNDLERAKSKKHETVESDEDWKKLCDYLASNEFQKMSAANTENRLKRKYMQTNGSVSTPNHQLRLNNELFCGVGHISTFKRNHTTKRGEWLNAECEKAYLEMVEVRFNNMWPPPLDRVDEPFVSDLDKLKKVLGQKSSYLRGWAKLAHTQKTSNRNNDESDDESELAVLRREVEGFRKQYETIDDLKQKVARLEEIVQRSSQGDTPPYVATS